MVDNMYRKINTYDENDDIFDNDVDHMYKTQKEEKYDNIPKKVCGYYNNSKHNKKDYCCIKYGDKCITIRDFNLVGNKIYLIINTIEYSELLRYIKWTIDSEIVIEYYMISKSSIITTNILSSEFLEILNNAMFTGELYVFPILLK